MTDLNSLASEAGYFKSSPLSMIASSLGSPTAYRLVAGVLTGLVVIHGLALVTAIESVLPR